jgi:transcriptional regulator with GAF, ATPase, and Fis domain
MIKLTESLNDLQQRLDESFKEVSHRISEINQTLAKKDTADCEKQLNELFRTFMERHRQVNARVARLDADVRKTESQFQEHVTEKEQFKALYNSGMVLSTAGELQGLIEFAMDQITYHLRADRGFLILVNEQGDREFFVHKNFDGDRIDDPANEVCHSVIEKALELVRPLKVTDDSASETIMKQGSFIRLGLRAVLCVPIVYRRALLGVVYLDRREEHKGFTDSDLTFLIAFARQIAYRVNELKELTRVQDEFVLRDRNRLQALREKYNFSEIIGRSEKLVQVLEIAAKVAATDATVMLLGESGVGKELIARAIHFNSDRFEQKFVALNCGAIPADLLESELFGYEPGAFTGAVKAKPGKFELAHRGTLFLDEIAELSVNLQAKILRVLQTHEIERLGGTDTRRLDIRIIAATNKELGRLVKEGKFREDLYYRLKVVEITVPPLRERREDVGLLVYHFIARYGEARVTEIDDNALDVLENYRWDGNIRELENVVQRAVVLAGGPSITINDLPHEIIKDVESGYRIRKDLTLEEAERDFRRWYVLRTLTKANNNKTKAAELLGVNRTHFFKMLNQLGITD